MSFTYFKYLFRSLRKNKIFSTVNILGLSIGLACAIIIYLFIEFELSFDNFYKNKDQIYRITRSMETATGNDIDGATSYPLAYSVRNDFPDLDFTSIYMLGSQDILHNEAVFKEENILFVDSAFFTVFNYKWMIGSSDIIKNHHKNIAITESLAKKYFNDENPIGKTITFSPDRNFQVVGVIEDQPLNSTLDFSMILSSENLNVEMIGFSYDNWNNTISGFECYAKIPDVVDISDVEDQMNDIIRTKYKENSNSDITQYSFQALSQVHLSPQTQNMPNTHSTSTTTLWVIAFIGLLIITVAGINFINLSTAQGLKRAKEVGVRKVLGASRSQVSFHFIKEYGFISLIALVISSIIVEVAIPYVNIFLGNNYDLSIYNSSYFILFFLILYVFILLVSVLYPSLVLSGFMPVKTLKGNIATPKQNVLSLRNALLVFQFVISIALIIATITIKKQINYINNKDLGFTIDNVMTFQLPDADVDKVESLRSFLATEPGVESYGFGIGPPSTSNNFTTSFHVEGEDNNTQRFLNLKLVDVNYPEVFDLELIAGNWFEKRVRGDSVFKLVINEKLYKLHGFKNPIDALNKRIPFGGNYGIICGVVKNFHTYSLHRDIDPLAFAYAPQFFKGMFVKIKPNCMHGTIANIERKMTEMFPGSFLEYETVSESLQEMYSKEDRIATIITVLSGLAILIASLGLFGLVSFMIVQKTKEIGIRKVLGASLQQIIVVLSQTYIKLILVASLIAIPLAWYFMSRWLNEFSYRIEIGIWVYILATFLAISIALITILFQVVKTGRMNPVHALKYE